jgi:two-component system, OmpR family, response regulator MprA
MGTRVLLVDDDLAVLSGLRRTMALDGYDVVVARDGQTALQLARTTAPDLIVLDVMLPELDGFSVCVAVRAYSAVPILMLTARDTVPDRVSGLDCGADDYLVKPFATDELLARARALLRRTHAPKDAVLRYADLALDLQACEATRGGRPLTLTPHELELIAVFLRHPRQVLSREQLSQQVWGYAFEGESNFVDVAVKELRKKIEAGGRSRLIQTIRGYGYALRGE